MTLESSELPCCHAFKSSCEVHIYKLGSLNYDIRCVQIYILYKKLQDNFLLYFYKMMNKNAHQDCFCFMFLFTL